ncbi:MAG: DNA-3-methyladenine glycosylase I [Ignavibacteriaceae bacterium]
MKNLQRCNWANSSLLYTEYHDNEWGVPIHDDKLLFEFLILEGFQAGLSWITILKKRNDFRKAFDHFNINKIARYEKEKIDELMNNGLIVRNSLKIHAAVQNANAFILLKKEFGSFDKYIWQFIGAKPKLNSWQNLKEVPASTPESDAMSKDLKKRGFKFVGSTICYAFMQAVGMVNDHIAGCFRYKELR